MKNANYNVLKLLHLTLDNLWRIEKHYLKDARGAKCDCGRMLKTMHGDLKRHAEALKKELARHHKKDGLA
jgi:hypothetical protein